MGKTPTMTPQCVDVLNYIAYNGKITTMEAFDELGCSRLSARIYDLRKMGYKITGKDKTKKLPNGRIKRWKVYRFAGREEAEHNGSP